MHTRQLGNISIGSDAPTAIIVEIADSHNGDMQTAKRMVDEAKKAGAHVAKFQLHLPDVEMVPGSIQMWDGPLYDILKKNLFTPEMHREIKDYCEQVGIQYLCTPFCPAAIDVLEDIGVAGYKVGSGELTHLPMHRKLATIAKSSGKTIIVSTGMSTFEEIAETVSIYEEVGAKDHLVLMYCVSEYPPKDYSHINLGMIEKMKSTFDVPVGLSDHTIDNFTAYAATALGAACVEKHFTLSRDQSGPDHFISLEPADLVDLVEGVSKIEASLGCKKEISAEEQTVRDWAHHSVVTSKQITQGDEFTLDNVEPRRPGTGIPAKYLDERYSGSFLGKKASKDMQVSTIVQWSDVES